MPRFCYLITFCLGLAACSETSRQAPDVVAGAPAETCGADRFQTLVGLTHDDLLQIEILGPVRVIRPDDAVTMDFLPSRLNIVLDGEDTVVRVVCG